MSLLFKLVLDRLPPSVNGHRKGWRLDHQEVSWFKSVVTAAVIDQLGYEALTLGLGSKKQPLSIEIGYVLGPKTRHSDTVSNREKALIDALKSAGVLSDDRWIRQGIIFSAEGPRDMTYLKLRTLERATETTIAVWFDEFE